MKKLISLGMAAFLPILPASAEVKLSERLTRIAGHLGEGGAHFAVTDSKDDLKNLGGLLDQFLRVLPEGEVPAGFMVESLFEDLGLFALEGSGSSAHKIGDLWHNRSFFLTNGKHEAVLSLLGDESKVSSAPEFAPAGADLILETSLDLREVERTVNKVTKAFGPEAEEELGEGLTAAVTSAGLSLADIFVDFTVRGTVVLWMDEEKTFEMGPGLELPVPHLVARLENAGLLWKILKTELEADDESVIEEKNGQWIIRPKEKEMEVPWGVIQPQFVWDPKTSQMFLAMSDADLEVCRGDGPKVSSDAEFRRATTGFPGKTSGLAYVSKDVLGLMAKLTREFSGEMPEEVQGMVMAVIPHLDKLAGQGGFAGGFSVEKDGFLFAANLPFPMKGSSSFTGLSGVTTVAVLAGMATPMIVKSKEAAEDTRLMIAMKEYAGAQILFQEEHDGILAESVKALSVEGLIDLELIAQLKESGFNITVNKGHRPETSTEIMAFAQSGTNSGLVIVARVDGSVSKISLEELELQLEKQKSK